MAPRKMVSRPKGKTEPKGRPEPKKEPISVRRRDLKQLQAVRQQAGVESFAHAARIILRSKPKRSKKSVKGKAIKRSIRSEPKLVNRPLLRAIMNSWLSERAIENLIASMKERRR